MTIKWWRWLGLPGRNNKRGAVLPSRWRRACLRVEELEQRLVLDNSSRGIGGILADGLSLSDFKIIGKAIELDGSGEHVAIGMGEMGRPGKKGIDRDRFPDMKQKLHPAVDPFKVLDLGGKELPGLYVNTLGVQNDHAVNVAGVMISKDGGYKGVAPGAKLYATSFGTPPRHTRVSDGEKKGTAPDPNFS